MSGFDTTVRGWAVDPASGREGAAELVVRDGVVASVTWLAGAEAEGITASGTLILPGLVDLHAHFREPGNEDAETVATGLAAAAHGGFTTVAVMPNTMPSARRAVRPRAGARRGCRLGLAR
ncbi:MAG: amidohydrolase family protein [Chloroflexota bacterium]